MLANTSKSKSHLIVIVLLFTSDQYLITATFFNNDNEWFSQHHPRDGFKLSTSSPTPQSDHQYLSPSLDIQGPADNDKRQIEDSFHNENNNIDENNTLKNRPKKKGKRPKRTIHRKIWNHDITKPFLPNIFSRQSQIERRIQKGRLVLDFGSYNVHGDAWQYNRWNHRPLSYFQSNSKLSTAASAVVVKASTRKAISSSSSSSSTPLDNRGSNKNSSNARIRMSVDPSSVGRLGVILFFAASSFGSAFMGTLRLLAPLVVSRRVLVFINTLITDWYAGRYFRKTLTKMEKIYIHYYETPATFRAISRTVTQFIVYITLGRIMGWLVGITHPPCRSEGRGLAFFCGLLWLGSVVGTGHAFATGVALWGGPLRLQAVHHPTRSSFRKLFMKPWHILQWFQNPEQWVSLIAIQERRPFDPNPIVFPATWAPLRLIQMIGVAKVAATEPMDYIWCPSSQDQLPKLMKLYLIQLALCDEWCRVFIGEKRIGLSLVVAFVYSFAMVSLIITCVSMNSKASVLLIPSLIAVIVSTWLNLVVYFNRYTNRRKSSKTVSTPINSL